MKNEKFEIGQKLWFVPNRGHGSARFVTITKVGRVYLTVEEIRQRVFKDTLHVDGGEYLSPGYCYLSPEEHDKQEALFSAWSNFRKQVYDSPVKTEFMTVEKIEEARRILFQ